MNQNSWLNHPEIEKLDPVKLELIRNAAMQVKGKNGTTMATVMMTLITSANKRKIQFTPEEVSLILEILKEGKSPQEKNQIDTMVKMVTNYIKKSY